MKEYIKPEAQLVTFESEEITASSDLSRIDYDGGDVSNILNASEEFWG